MSEPNANDAATPAPGEDSRVEDWFGQSVERDRQVAERVDSEAEFEEQATGREEQQARHGEHIDPDQGRSAYLAEGGEPRSGE
jgi:hypothetical protein